MQRTAVRRLFKKCRVSIAVRCRVISLTRITGNFSVTSPLGREQVHDPSAFREIERHDFVTL
jgi:hypothetical protein